MNWKILGKAFLVTAILAGLIIIIFMAITVIPWWITAIIVFIIVVALVYSGMKADYEFGNDNDRMSWNSDDEEDDDETDTP